MSKKTSILGMCLFALFLVGCGGDPYYPKSISGLSKLDDIVEKGSLRQLLQFQLDHKDVEQLIKEAEEGDNIASLTLGYYFENDNSSGFYFKHDGNLKKDYSKSTSYYSQACSRGLQRGCYSLAGAFYYGKGVERDQNKGMELYERSARDGLNFSKSWLADKELRRAEGEWEENAEKKWILPHALEASKELKTLKKLCQSGFGSSCQDVASYYDTLGLAFWNIPQPSMHDKRYEVSKKEYIYSRRGCEQGWFYSCSELAIPYHHGYKVDDRQLFDKSLRNAYDLHSAACDYGVVRACAYMYGILANNEFEGYDLLGGLKGLKRTCLQNTDAIACEALGKRLVTLRDNKEVISQFGTAEDVLSEACVDLNMDYVCGELGGIYESRGELSTAAEIYEYVCDRGYSTNNVGGRGHFADCDVVYSYLGRNGSSSSRPAAPARSSMETYTFVCTVPCKTGGSSLNGGERPFNVTVTKTVRAKNVGAAQTKVEASIYEGEVCSANSGYPQMFSGKSCRVEY